MRSGKLSTSGRLHIEIVLSAANRADKPDFGSSLLRLSSLPAHVVFAEELFDFQEYKHLDGHRGVTIIRRAQGSTYYI